MKSEQEVAGSFSVRTTEGKEVKLAMQELWVTGQITPVGARLVIRHVFESQEKKMLEAVYAFGLPRDAALCQFRIEGPGFTARSELRSVKEAREVYEEGVEKGHLAALAQTYRDGRVNLTLGNLRPKERVVVFLEMMVGVESKDTGFRFRFPFTLAPTYHLEARYVESAPGVGEMELPESKFGDLILPPFHRDANNLHRVGFDLEVRVPDLTEIASPSHTLRVRRESSDVTRLGLGCEGDVPNRDLIVDGVMPADPVVLLAQAKKGPAQMAALIPSTLMGTIAVKEKRIVFLLDHSGSMAGVPLEQAKMAIGACLSALNDKDSFGIVAFADDAKGMSDGLLKANEANRATADRFLKGIQVAGGTELLGGFLKAGEVLEGKGGEVFLVTDGQVSETDTLIAKARAQEIRIHTLGIGSAAQDRFLEELARETGGISRCVTTTERVDLAALDLFASCTTPVAEGLSASVLMPDKTKVAVEPEARRIVFAGVPTLVFAEMKPVSGAMLELTWTKPEDGRQEIALGDGVKNPDLAQTLKLLRGARLLADAEVKYPVGEGEPGKTQARAKKWIEKLSQTYGLASRYMALVAVVERAGDKPGEPPSTQIIPVGMPQDVEMDSYFGAKQCLHPMSASVSQNIPRCCSMPEESDLEILTPSASPSPRLSRKTNRQVLNAVAPESEQDILTHELMMQIMRMESDGGLPGQDEAERVAKSLLLLLLLAENGFTLGQGAFRVHIRKLMEFVEDPARQTLWEGSGCRVFAKELLADLRQDIPRKTVHIQLAARLSLNERLGLEDLATEVGA